MLSPIKPEFSQRDIETAKKRLLEAASQHGTGEYERGSGTEEERNWTLYNAALKELVNERKVRRTVGSLKAFRYEII